MPTTATPRDAFKRASLYQTCRRSRILSNVRFDELSTEALVELVNEYNAQTITHVPILASKFLAKALLGLVTKRFPDTLAYITPDNIRVAVEDDELAYLATARSTASGSGGGGNIVLIVGKNILMALVGNSIVQLRDILTGKAASAANDGIETMDEDAERVPGDFERIRMSDGFSGNRHDLAQLNVRPNFSDNFGSHRSHSSSPPLPDSDPKGKRSHSSSSSETPPNDNISIASAGSSRKRARIDENVPPESVVSSYAEDDDVGYDDYDEENSNESLGGGDDVAPMPPLDDPTSPVHELAISASKLRADVAMRRPFDDDIADLSPVVEPAAAAAHTLSGELEASDDPPPADAQQPLAPPPPDAQQPLAQPPSPPRRLEKFDFAGLVF